MNIGAKAMRKSFFVNILRSLAVLAVLLGAAGLLRATIFSAMPSSKEEFMRPIEELRGVAKNVKTDFGTARVDETKSPAEIAVGELRSLWRGHWQLGGGKLDINRAKATDLRMDRASSEVRFRVRWTAGNEAVARSAKHKFVMKVVRVEAGAETVVETVTKEVTLKGKGVGKTVFENGTLRSPKIAVAPGAEFKIVLQARNDNTGASLETSTVIDFKK